MLADLFEVDAGHERDTAGDPRIRFRRQCRDTMRGKLELRQAARRTCHLRQILRAVYPVYPVDPRDGHRPRMRQPHTRGALRLRVGRQRRTQHHRRGMQLLREQLVVLR